MKRITIISEDELFSEMLRIEAGRIGIAAERKSEWEAGTAEIVLLDLDSCRIPEECEKTVIGFTRQSARSSDQARKCAMILRRPFEMEVFRNEILSFLTEKTEPLKFHDVRQKRQFFLSKTEKELQYGDKKIPLTVLEYQILQTLIENCGEAVAKEQLLPKVNGNQAEVYICMLRKKTDPQFIRTVRKKGYMIE